MLPARLTYFALMVALLFLSSVKSFAQEPQIKIAQAGQNITIWDGWNVTGKIFIKIDGGDGDDCIELWWITMGVNSSEWKVCNSTEIEVSLPLVYGELRAGGFQRKSAIAVSDIASVAYSQELCGRIIEC